MQNYPKKTLRSSHCRKISPLRSSPLRGLPSTRSRRVWTAFRSCPRHHHSHQKPLAVLPNEGYEKRPRPSYSQEQKAPLLKLWLILFSAFIVSSLMFVSPQGPQTHVPFWLGPARTVLYWAKGPFHSGTPLGAPK